MCQTSLDRASRSSLADIIFAAHPPGAPIDLYIGARITPGLAPFICPFYRRSSAHELRTSRL